MEEDIKKYKIQFGLLTDWLPIPWHRRHRVRLSFCVFLQIFLFAFLLAVLQKGQAEANRNAGMKAEFANPLGMPSAAPGVDQSANRAHADEPTKAHSVEGVGEKKTVVARVKKKKESWETLKKLEPKSKAATVEKDAIKMGPEKEKKAGQNAIKMGPYKEKHVSTGIDADSLEGKRVKRQIESMPIQMEQQMDSSNLDIDKQLNMFKNDSEYVMLNLTDPNTPWNMTFTLNAFKLACNDQQDATSTESNPKKCMEMHFFCNEDGTNCKREEVEDEDGCQEETPEQKNDYFKMQCKDVGNKFQSNFSRQYVLCYESALEQMKPQFSLHNIKNNPLANFCPEKWHGFGQIFWVTKEKGDDENLFLNSIIHFSFTNQTLQLPTIKVPIIENDSPFVPYSLTFDIISIFSVAMEEPETDSSGAEAANFLAIGRHALQNIAGLWSIFLDMANSNSSNMHLYLSKEAADCEEFIVKINGKSKLQNCRESDERTEKTVNEAKEILEILAEVRRLGKICHANATRTSSTTNPELQNWSNISLGIGVKKNGDKVTMHIDVVPDMEKALAWLEKARKECQHLLNNTAEEPRVKRQIGEKMFVKYTNITDFNWSKNYWGKFPNIAYTFHDFQYKEEWKEDIEKALKMISDKTCISFKHYKHGAISKNDYFLQFYNHFPQCFTQIGRNELGGERSIFVGFKNCPTGRIAHEVMHTLGFEHEQIRSDRDDSVWIRDEAIEPDENLRYQFIKAATKNFNITYDFGSIMHYGPWYFNVEGAGYTIVAKQRAYQHTMGQRVAPSFKDIKLLNRIYCSEKCKAKLVCANGGYTDPKDCSKCRCPPGFGGKHCDRYERGKSQNCYSGRYYADTMQKHIVVSELMDGAQKCHWTIKTVQIKQRILLTVYWLDNFECKHPCDENGHLEIQMLKDKSSRGARLCCGTRDYLPYTMMLEPGVDALITLRRSSDKQRFGLIYETPDAIVPAEKLAYTQGCFCNGLYNPWHKPGDTHVDHLNKPIIYGLSINTETNFIINGKYRIHTQNGSVWFTRHCAKTSNSVNAFSMWEEPINGSVVRIDHIVAEPCVTDYENSGCKELNDKWKKFIECLKRNPHECEKKFSNFRIQICGN